MTSQPLRRLLLGIAVCLSGAGSTCADDDDQSRSRAAGPDRPNVILFIGDDISWNDYGCYGNTSARTPNIDALAESGVRFTSAFLTASSCSPSRSSIVTGRYPHNNGPASELHLPISGHLPWFPALLRDAGYYTAIVGKHHMSTVKSEGTPKGKSFRESSFDLVDPSRAPGNSGGHANWVKTVEHRPKDKPFFFWFAAYDAHRGWDGDKQWKPEYGRMHSAASVRVPPFLSSDQGTAEDLASYYNEVTRFDYYIGQVVEALKKQNALDNTLLLVMADNGRPFPRAKTRLHDSGMKTALVAHWGDGIKRPGVCSRLVSAVDIAPTILELANVKKSETMQGFSFTRLLRDPDAAPVREAAYSEHNWHDYEAHGRSVRDGKYLYIRNYRPQLAWQGPADSVRSVSHKQLQNLRALDKLTPAQADVFLAPRPEEELYDTEADPHQLHNLASDPQYKDRARFLSRKLDAWMEGTGDTVPESISQDSFDRETGERLKTKEYRGTWPGKSRRADYINVTK